MSASNQQISFAKKSLALQIKRLLYPNPKLAFLAGAVLGCLFFLSIFGTFVLGSSHVDWLLNNSGDLKQHYTGWVFFRLSPWKFPLGTITSFAYPFGLPVTFTDSIPLLALIFKSLSAILPQTFQYLGMWGLISYMLQGGFGALITKKLSKNIIIIAIGSAFFILSPIMLVRMFVHTALASQWLLLAAIWLLMEFNKHSSLRKQLFAWSIALILATLIHPYFIPMVAFLLALSTVRSHRSWHTSALKLFLPPTLAAIVFWAIGGFSVKNVDVGGLGTYALNLDSLYNPMGFSRFFSTITNFSPSFESTNYLGAGMLFLLPIAAYLAIERLGNFHTIKLAVKSLTPRHYIMCIIVLSMLALAVSPEVQFGNRLLFHIPTPKLVFKGWSIYRTTARLFWPVYYLIMTGILAAVIKLNRKLSPAILCVLLCGALCIQVVDVRFSPNARNIHGRFYFLTSKDTYKSPLDIPAWVHQISDRKHMVFLGTIPTKQYMELIDVAMKDNLTMSNGYYARTPATEINAYESTQLESLLQGTGDVQHNVYITVDANLAAQIRDRHHYVVTQLNGFYLIT